MAHTLSLTDAQKAVLYSPHVPTIGLRVVFRGLVKLITATADDGTYTFSDGFKSATIDISNRVKLGTGIKISTSKPILPTGKGNSSKGANVKLTLINTDGYFAVTQDNSIISADHIQDGYIDIYSTFGDQELLMYTGRIIGRPTEKRGETIITLRDSMMSIVDNPLAYYNGSQNAKVEFVNNELEITPASFGSLRLSSYAAGVYFNQEGRPYPSIENSDPTKIDLINIDIRPAFVSPISKYQITFTGPRQYTVVFPTDAPVIGTVDEDFDENNLRINKEYWSIPGDNKLVIDVADIELEDLTGVEITIYACYSVSGNPISICKHLLDKAFRAGKAVSINNGSFPVDWDRLDELEKMFDSYTLYVSETNKDPSVYDPSSTRRPISYKNVLENVLEHINCYLIVNTSGQISISGPWLMEGEEVYDITSDMLTTHEFTGNLTKYERLRVKYGHNLLSDSYNSESIFEGINYEALAANEPYKAGDVVSFFGIYYVFTDNYTPGVTTNILGILQVLLINEFEISYRYFKSGKHLRRIESIQCNTLDRVWNSNVQLSCKVLPNHGLPLREGDKVRFVLTEQPKKTMYAEIFSVNKKIGEEVVIKAVLIASPVHPVELCETVLCADLIY